MVHYLINIDFQSTLETFDLCYRLLTYNLSISYINAYMYINMLPVCCVI